MWMAYAETNNEEIVDLKGAVISLQSKFGQLAFDAEHEAIYGLNQFYIESECMSLAQQYNRGYQACTNYLNKGQSIDRLILKLEEYNLTRFLGKLKNFLPSNLQQHVSNILGSDDDADSYYTDDDKEYETATETCNEKDEDDDVELQHIDMDKQDREKEFSVI